MVIAISRTDPKRWLKLERGFPLEVEVLSDYFLFDTPFDSLKLSVAYAKRRRLEELGKEVTS